MTIDASPVTADAPGGEKSLVRVVPRICKANQRISKHPVLFFRVLRGLRSNGPTGRFILAPMVSTDAELWYL